MNPVWIFRHIECEGPGYLEVVLKRYDIPFELIAIDQQASVPSSIDNCSGLVFMGGTMSVNDDLPWIEQELTLIRQADEKSLPVLGHCLGGQLISKALGGSITANAVKEMGWHLVQRIENPEANNWLTTSAYEFEGFHWHGETFSIPAGATPILKSRYCDNQAFVKNNILALQCHVEMNADMVTEWTQLYAHDINTPSESVQSAEQMVEHLDARIDAMQEVADTLYVRWLRPIMETI